MIVSHFLFLFQENLNTALFPSEYTTSLLRGQWKHSVNKLVFGVERLFFLNFLINILFSMLLFVVRGHGR